MEIPDSMLLAWVQRLRQVQIAEQAEAVAQEMAIYATSDAAERSRIVREFYENRVPLSLRKGDQ